MSKIILDTNFILTCIENKIDFLDEIKYMGHEAIIPKQVIDEIKAIHGSNKKMKFRNEAEIALKIIQKRKPKRIDIKERYVDKGLIKYAEDKPEVIIATLDERLHEKLKNKKMIIRTANKKLEEIQ